MRPAGFQHRPFCSRSRVADRDPGGFGVLTDACRQGAIMILVLSPMLAVAVRAGETGPQSDRAAILRKQIQPFFEQHCLDCHGEDTQEGDLRLDTLGYEVGADGKVAEQWQKISQRMILGEMPPEDMPRPDQGELDAGIERITTEVQYAVRILRSKGGNEVVFRRLNKNQFNYTVHDLFGLEGHFSGGFPEDATELGFDNIGSGLILSASQMESYLTIADVILGKAIVSGGPPKTQKLSFKLVDPETPRGEKDSKSGRLRPYGEQTMNRSFSLNRRTFLRGAGAAMALPWLEAMEPSICDASTPSVTDPRRMVLINLNLGLYAPAFFPEQAGRDYAPSEYLEVIQDSRNDFTVMSGLSHPGVVGGHAAEYRIFNGTPSKQKLGISLDQFAAKVLGRFTRFDTLPMGMGNTNLSWTSTGSPVPAEARMALVFDRLFGDDGASGKQAARRGLKRSHSILDLVNGQAERMKPRISQTDRKKLDEFFTTVREVERRLQKSESWLDTPKPDVAVDPPVDPRSRSQFIERMQNVFDMAYLAVKTDSTRIVTFNIFEQNTVAIEGVNNGYHNLSHHGKDPENVRQLKLIETEIIKHLNRFLTNLKLQQLGIQADSFSTSTGPIEGLQWA